MINQKHINWSIEYNIRIYPHWIDGNWWTRSDCWRMAGM